MLTTSGELHFDCMRKAIALARQCKPIPTAFCVGCLMTKTGTSEVISEGYSRELEGNTHAEQCAIMKILNQLSSPNIPTYMDIDLYTTMEPCSVRLSGNKPCTDLILELINPTISTVGSRMYTWELPNQMTLLIVMESENCRRTASPSYKLLDSRRSV
ncbi:hypothetical protein KEM48_002391 [Puccinia striiformis f. sp. tritici PST-130]|nr:hypothetical protein KEM48_002391 [Puccinia striiformis f. sp. tritici PST-130]